MEEVLNDDDDDVKEEKSSVEKMEKHAEPKSKVQELQPSGIHCDSLNIDRHFVSFCCSCKNDLN